jgi:hypothetical protein
MSQPPRVAPMHVPVLTEVIEVHDLDLSEALTMPPGPISQAPHTVVTLDEVVPQPLPVMVQERPLEPAALRETVLAPGQYVVDEAQLAQRVLADVQKQIDSMLEFRLRESLAPILASAAEALVRELRQELSRTMTDVVARSVAQEVARQRPRG